MKHPNILSVLATAAIILLLSACTGETPEPGLDAGLCQITHIQVNSPGAITRALAPATGSDGRPVTQFAAGDIINISAYPGAADQSVVNTAAVATDPEGNGNLVWTFVDGDPVYVHLTGDKGIFAEYIPTKDKERTPDEDYSIYYDYLWAAASAADGTIVAAGNGQSAHATLNFDHVYSLVQIASIKDNGGTDIAPNLITHIELFITNNRGESRKIYLGGGNRLGTDVIVPHEATLNSLRITDAYGQVFTAPFPAGTSTTQSGSRYPLAVTLHPHNATVQINDITPWGAEEVVTPPSTLPIGYDYVVATHEDLIALRDVVNANANLPGTSILARTARVIQVANITLPAGTEWVPISSDYIVLFSGTYNGNGYTISGLQTANDYNGAAAGLFGWVYGSTADNPAILTGIHLRGCTITGTNASAYYGALAGSIYNTVISHCSSTGNVTGGNYTGGLVGCATSNSYINRSRSSCTVTGSSFAGGLVGYTEGTYITACTASGTVTGFNVGGLVGPNNGTITCCYATGNAETTDPTDGRAGGLVGSNGGEGYNVGTISHCYATGTATAGTAGTFAGKNYATITLCHASGAEPAVPVGTTYSNATSDVSTATGQAGTTVRTATNGTTPYTFPTKTVRTMGNSVMVVDYTFVPTGVWTDGVEPTINYGLQ
ncbi:fimbrillin family protein [Bacteroides sp. 51]|uniref:fimbrillin family protein n=1 Tax=Bacteroides sp. 51 TaxID=2302938 RepID=UPI0013D073F2|nr:fimbrillin family protein [Bacteroides sp. 51]NDV82054.1 hypothetical protein [Bacteroides sp. 51]